MRSDIEADGVEGMKKGIVYLVGAGPGDPGLITVKGLECIKKADVLVYDRLASRALVSQARPDAELIYVGKGPDRHTLRQEEINVLLADKAAGGKVVTRLKGGDPFIFGRGGEEAEVLAERGIPFEIVPGVTSAIAAPAYAGIPLTHRDFTSTVAIITGHEDPTKDDTAIHWDRIATGIGTLVFLMGMENLPKIVSRLIEYGRPSSTPVALVRWGTRVEQRAVTGTLADIVEMARQEGITSPAVIVVGEVVSLRGRLKWFENKPLFGKRILVTRSRAQASDLSDRIRELGGEPLEFPVIRIEDPESWNDLDAALDRLGQYAYVILTSPNGVEKFMHRLLVVGKDARSLAGIRVITVGPQTAEALAARGINPDLVPAEFRGGSIIEALRAELKPGQRVLLARADIADDTLPEGLKELGAMVDDCVAYRTVLEKRDAAELREMLSHGAVHYATFASSSTVKNLLEVLGAEGVSLLKKTTVACIGPVTAKTAREAGLEVAVLAREATIESLVQAIVEDASKERP